jgi:hypothetical protein
MGTRDAISSWRSARFLGRTLPWRLSFTSGAVIVALILAAGVSQGSEYRVGNDFEFAAQNWSTGNALRMTVSLRF